MLTADQLAVVLALLDTHPRRHLTAPLIPHIEAALAEARAAQPPTPEETH